MKCPDCGADNLAGEEVCEACGGPLSQLSLPEAKAKTAARRRILAGTIADLKPRAAVTISPERTVVEAVELMRRSKTGCVVVVDGGEHRGLVTERDILNKVAGLKDPAKARVAEVMSTEVGPMSESDAIAFAFHDMALRGHRHIPIRRKDGTLGVISSRDLLRYLCQ